MFNDEVSNLVWIIPGMRWIILESANLSFVRQLLKTKHLEPSKSRDSVSLVGPVDTVPPVSLVSPVSPNFREKIAKRKLVQFFKEVVKMAKFVGTDNQIPFISYLTDKKQCEALSLLRTDPLHHTVSLQTIGGRTQSFCSFFFPNCNDDDCYQSNSYYMEVDDNPLLLYTYIQLAAACIPKGGIGSKLRRMRVIYPFSRLYHFDSNSGKVASNTIIVALLLTRCNSPRLDMLIFNENTEKLVLINSEKVMRPLLKDSWCSPGSIINEDYRCRLNDMMAQYFVINSWIFDHTRNIKLDTHHLGNKGYVVSIDKVLSSLKEWNLQKGTRVNPIESKNLIMSAHINKLETALKELNEKILQQEEQLKEKRKATEHNDELAAKTKKIAEDQDNNTKKLNQQSAQISKLQKIVVNLQEQKTPSKKDESGLITDVAKLKSQVLELSRKRPFEASNQSTPTSSANDDSNLQHIKTLQAAWDREKYHSDLANKRIDEERQQKIQKDEFEMTEKKLASQHNRNLEAGNQRVDGIKSIAVNSKLDDNNIKALSILNGGGNLMELLFPGNRGNP